MDSKTIKYYVNNATEIFQRYNSVEGGVSEYFAQSFQAPSRILDVGCGSGRDIRRLLDAGHDAWGIEPSNELRTLISTNFPEIAHRISDGCLPDPGNPFGGNFDAILCSAVLMHIPSDQLPAALHNLRKLLNNSGRLLLSIPWSRHGISEGRRDDKGRLFSDITPDTFENLLEKEGLHLMKKWINEDAMNRPGFSWVTMLFGPLGHEV